MITYILCIKNKVWYFIKVHSYFVGLFGIENEIMHTHVHVAPESSKIVLENLLNKCCEEKWQQAQM